jgi:hypothetical protein
MRTTRSTVIDVSFRAAQAATDLTTKFGACEVGRRSTAQPDGALARNKKTDLSLRGPSPFPPLGMTDIVA